MKPKNYLKPIKYVCDRCEKQYELDSELHCICHETEQAPWHEQVCIDCLVSDSVIDEKMKDHLKNNK